MHLRRRRSARGAGGARPGHAGAGGRLWLSACRRGPGPLGRRRLFEKAAGSFGLARGQRAPMSDLKTWAALIIGVVMGALAALLWRARREQALRIEAELLRARVKTEAMLSAEREQTLVRARDQLQGEVVVFRHRTIANK